MIKKYYFHSNLFVLITAIISFGVIMVSSASIPVAERYSLSMLYHTKKQIMHIFLGIGLCGMISFVPIKTIEKYIKPVFFLNLFFLCLIFIPGLGKQVNGSTRWLRLVFFDIQVSEFIKLTYIIFLAKYLADNKDKVNDIFIGFIKPMSYVGFIAILLLLEPDFGTTVVLVLTTLWMLFLAGARIKNFLFLSVFILSLLAIISVSSPYRINRLVAFLDPWQDQFNTGYQLTQSLIAFGQGGVFGAGLGKSVQKLLYLPESHTDFILSVIAEELGIVGLFVLLFVMLRLIFCIFQIAKKAREHNLFASYISIGIALWITLQTIINIGVTTGMLPTKGITLPFISYGGNSILALFLAMGILFRIDFEQNYKSKSVVLVEKKR